MPIGRCLVVAPRLVPMVVGDANPSSSIVLVTATACPHTLQSASQFIFAGYGRRRTAPSEHIGQIRSETSVMVRASVALAWVHQACIRSAADSSFVFCFTETMQGFPHGNASFRLPISCGDGDMIPIIACQVLPWCNVLYCDLTKPDADIIKFVTKACRLGGAILAARLDREPTPHATLEMSSIIDAIRVRRECGDFMNGVFVTIHLRQVPAKTKHP